MIYNKNNIADLTTENGGRFSVVNSNDAFDFCKKVTINHYENFPVASLLLPREIRQYIYSIYAFARIADDIADEYDFHTGIRSKLLDNYHNILMKITSVEQIRNPVFSALRSTIQDMNISKEPFEKLLKAFKYDINFKQPDNWEDVLNYCNYSANPIGEIILKVFNNSNKRTIKLSASICTGLQLVNFWQDLSVDLSRNRLYIPKELLFKYGLTKENLDFSKNSANLSKCLKEIYDFTEDYFTNGSNLFKYITNLKFRLEIKASLNGGILLLKKLRKMGNEVLNNRPRLRKIEFLLIFLNSIIR
jgi:squalene synthase HpnC